MNDDIEADVTDRMLLQRMSTGDRVALGVLYRSYHGRLCRFLSRLTRRADVIDEVINDCFWIAWQKAGSFHGDSRVSTWLMGIAYRCGLKALRQHGDEPVENGWCTCCAVIISCSSGTALGRIGPHHFPEH